MGITVTDDMTQLASGDSITNWTLSGGYSMPALDTSSNIEGTGCIAGKVSLTPQLGMAMFNHGLIDLTDKILYVSLFFANPIETLANGGIRIRISSATNGTSNYGEWDVGGSDIALRTYSGWLIAAVDTKRPFDRVNGTPPALTAVVSSGGGSNVLKANGKEVALIDEIKYGNKVTITGGAAIPRGSPEHASDDKTDARGLFQDVLGVYYLNGLQVIGDVTAATNSTFEDSNKVWNFQEKAIQATQQKIEVVGGTGTNRVTFGSSSGTGNAKEGSSGNIFNAGGDNPFRLECIDSDVVSEFFGCTFINPVTAKSTYLADYVYEDNSLTSFTNDTRDANDAGASDATVLSALNDAVYFGMDERFNSLSINTGTAVTGSPVVVWEYSTGAGWSALTNVSDGTSAFTTTGAQTVDFAIPDDWTTRAVTNGGTRYYIRARFTTAGTGTGQITQVTASLGGGVRAEHTNFEAIRCTFVNMDTIRIRNSAKLKKCVITNSVASAKNGALDLGSSDPAADTVRDLTIQKCSKGILLKGTSIGTTTYNFRNIKFSNNTNDVRVDFPSAATVVINVLEGGDTPTIDNVNSSTVTINNSVPITITAVEGDFTTVNPGARVAVNLRISPFTEYLNVLTNASGVASGTHNYVSDIEVFVRVRDEAFNYKKVPGTITSSGLVLTVAAENDSKYTPT